MIYDSPRDDPHARTRAAAAAAAMSALDDLYDLPPGVHQANESIATVTPPGVDLGSSIVTRCWPEVDSLVTAGERRGAHHICLDWAHGCCTYGVQCALCHKLPTLADEQRLIYSADGLTSDIFGRKKQESSGRMLYDPLACQTICITGLPPELTQQERRRALDSLDEWGKIARTWVVADPRVGYVKFRWRSVSAYHRITFLDTPVERRPSSPIICPPLLVPSRYLPLTPVSTVWHLSSECATDDGGHAMALTLALTQP